MCALLLFLVITTLTTGLLNGQVITTNRGNVAGIQETFSVDGEDMIVTKFLGIPYAKPPVGDLRFEPAEQPDPWEDTLQATEYPPQCIQLDAVLERLYLTVDGLNPAATLDDLAKAYGMSYPSEDCLYLNVFVPRADVSTAESLSVMVWVHDGGFVFSSANVNDGALLALEGDIIVVSINYRLGGLGFLTVENATNIVRGNLGLKDQVMAIKWVNENIANFGGNPDDVTLFGNSAGAASVVGHMCSPMTRGLFHRAIVSSGAPNHIPWMQTDIYRAMSKGFIANTPCYSEDTDQVLACLKSLPVEVFAGLSADLQLLPVIDGEFIPASPELMMKTGQMHVKDVMYGGNEGEGTLVLNNVNAFLYMNEDIFKQMISPFAYLYSKGNSEGVASLLWYEYITENADTAALQQAYIDVHRDMLLSTQTRNLQYLKQAGGSLYQYHFTHRSSTSPWPPIITGAHSSDIKFILPRNDTIGDETPEELALSKDLRRAWSNYVKTGDPNPITDDPTLVWPSYDLDTKYYLEIDTDLATESVQQGLQEKKMRFWNEIIYQMADKPWEGTASGQCPAPPDDNDENPQVEVASGVLQGKAMESNGKKWEEYLGIPYAAPPIGDLRWKKPQPASAWSGVLDATTFGSVCPQGSNSVNKRFPVGGTPSEDCLNLNIYVPTGVKYVRYLGLPVMVFIHGGSGTEGSGSAYPGQYLALHGSVLVVTINYRMGTLGFLTTYDQESPGNYGLWDQNLALKWVQQNIEQFGGDPDRVTVFGQSKGAISASMHLFSPHSEGLMQGVIAQSGTAYSPLGFIDPSSLLALAHNFGKYFNCPTNSSSLMMNCLRQVDADDITNAAVTNGPEWSGAYSSPCIDGDFFPINVTDTDAFVLTKSPSASLMTGFLHDEVAEQTGFSSLFKTMDQLDAQITSMTNLFYRNSEAVAAATRFVYIDGAVQQDESVRMKTGIDLTTDAYFRGPAVKLALDYSVAGGQTYLYNLRHRPTESTAPTGIEGVLFEDLYYILGLEQEKNLVGDDVILSREVMTYWTNFAHSGDPNKPVPVPVTWPQFQADSKMYLELASDVEAKESQAFDRARQLHFWAAVVPSMEGSSTCAPVNGNNNGSNGSGNNGKGGDGDGDGDDDDDECDGDDDDDDDDDLKLGVVISACMAGGSLLLSLIMLCCLCNIRNRLTGKPQLSGIDNQAARF